MTQLYVSGVASKWEHRTCAGLSINEYDMLTTSSNQIMFFCTMCYTKVSFALRVEDENTTKLQSVENKLSEKINNIEAKLLDLHNAVKETHITDRLQESTSIEEPKKQFSSFMSSFMNEEKEKDKRRLNLIIHNIVESTDVDSSVRKEHDINLVDSILKKYLGISAKIERAIRLGKRTDKSNTDKPRLLKISVSSEHDKAKILRTCTSLSQRENPQEIQKLFITPDLTPHEQEINKKLRIELKELNKEGNLYRIKNGKIIWRECQK